MAIEQVTDIGLEEPMDPLGDGDGLADSEVLIEIVWTANGWVVLCSVSECERAGIGPAARHQVLCVRGGCGSDAGGVSVARCPRYPIWPFQVASKEGTEVARHGDA